jgi:hypothetical protein
VRKDVFDGSQRDRVRRERRVDASRRREERVPRDHDVLDLVRYAVAIGPC